MKIAIDIRAIGKQRTGDETVFLNLTRELAKIDMENRYFLCIDTRSEEELEAIRERLGIVEKKNFALVSLGSGNKFTWNAFTVPRFIRREGIDLFHTQYITPFLVSKKTKIVTHIHDVSFCVYPDAIGKIDLFFLRTLIPLSIRRADAIAAVSEFTKKEIGKYYGEAAEKRTHVVKNGISRYAPEAISEDACLHVRKKYALPEKFFLNVGTLQPRKNIPFLLRAFDLFADRVQGFSLVLTGNQSGHNVDIEIETTLKTLKHTERIIFTGYIASEDLPALYALSRGAVFPSKYEGFGLSVGEALLAGVSVFASDIPPHHEVGGTFPVYFDPNDVAKLTELLYDSSIAERRFFPKEKLDSEIFRWEDAAKQMKEVYRSLF